MPGSTEFLPFATAGGANVASQASWAGATDQTGGFLTGIADSQRVNKAIRQGTFMAAVVATFMASVLSATISDNGDLNGAVTNLEAALSAFSQQSSYGAAGGTANVLTLAGLPGRAALADGMLFLVKIGTTNTGAATLNYAAGGALPIVRLDGAALKASDLLAASIVSLIYSSSANVFILADTPPNANRGFRNCQMLTTSGNFVVGAGITNIYVECVGGGASGGGSTGAGGAGGGGGGGAWSADMVAVVPAQSIAYTIGAKGVGSSGAGQNGGATSFGGVIASNGGLAGGLGGTSGAGNGGTGGAPTAGTLGLNGAQGDAGTTNGSYATAGRGGDAARGGGAGGAPGGTAQGIGAGGGGNILGSGGDGQPGAIFVFW